MLVTDDQQAARTGEFAHVTELVYGPLPFPKSPDDPDAPDVPDHDSSDPPSSDPD